jgi:hypothetical protein
VISVGAQRVITCGDAFDSPIQVTHPLGKAIFDHDREQAAILRLKLVAELADPDTIGLGIHFAACPSAASTSTAACGPGSQSTPEPGTRAHTLTAR